MDIHQIYIDEKILNYGFVDDKIKLCSLPANSTFISIENKDGNIVITYSIPSESEITIDIGQTEP